MRKTETLNAILSGILMPCLLVAAGLFFGVKLRFFWLRHPIRTLRTLREGAAGGGTSPFAALTMALAGTLGVGNIAGVATAITAGGAGAVFWMVAGAFAAMAVKYAEVALAVRFRRSRTEGGRRTHYGGAMYYIRDGLFSAVRAPFWQKASAVFGGAFAVLCVANSLLTGNIVQVRSAVFCVDISPLWFGIFFAVLAVIAMAGGMRRLSAITVILIPVLAVLYLVLSLVIIAAHIAEVPHIFVEIIEDAFDFSAVGGGVLGLTVSRAIRFGITRGIFSNEAGCGTAPTAHAAADVKNPHHQGCFGIFEVFADTVLLCTVTAIVILLYGDREGLDGIALSLAAFTRLGFGIGGAGFATAVDLFMRASIILFAYATVVCQSYYGIEAIRYFIPARSARWAYIVLSAAAVMIGAVIEPGVMWRLADFVVSGMTALNVVCLLRLSRFIEKPEGDKRKSL